MSIYSGSFSISQYRVLGRNKELSLSDLNQKLRPNQAQPISLKSQRELGFAWEKPILDDLSDPSEGNHWDMSDCQVEDGFLIRMRVEKRSVSNSLIQLHYKEKLQNSESKLDQKLGRKARKELLEQVRLELVQQSLPTIQYIDVMWFDSDDTVLLFSTSKGMQTMFEELFRKTFCDHLNLSIVRKTPPLLGLSDEEWKGEKTEDTVLHRIKDTLPLELSSISL